MTSVVEPETTARMLLQRAVYSLVPQTGMATGPAGPGQQVEYTAPQPRAGLAAVRRVATMLRDMGDEYVLGLRGEGVSWDEVAELLDVHPDPGYRSRGEVLFDQVVGPPADAAASVHGRHLYWRCGTCQQMISHWATSATWRRQSGL